MRTTRTLRFLIAILCFSYLGSVYAQDPTVTITLTVDTSLLGDDKDAPGGCTFIVVPADKVLVNDPNNPKTFSIKVEESDIIEWQGITTAGGEVEIKRIKHVGGTNIFDSTNIYGRIHNGKEKVKAKPNKKTPRDADYVYSIKFKPVGFRTFVLDPKIKVGNQ
tara:strand:+ start:600 stop:1088 length:489 start_codon:yes stop_codon:yes gene_type:complete